MKKRLEVLPYTQEDWFIMRNATSRWMLRHDGPYPLATIYVPSDRSAADLMLQLCYLRSIRAHRQVLLLQLLAGQDGYTIRGRFYSWESKVWGCGEPRDDE